MQYVAKLPRDTSHMLVNQNIRVGFSYHISYFWFLRIDDSNSNPIYQVYWSPDFHVLPTGTCSNQSDDDLK